MAAWLKPDLTTMAFCWRLDRRDGVTLGFTSHDRDLLLGGLLCRSAPGMAPSAITRSEGLEAATLDVGGALTSDAITDADLAAGRWDGARVRLWAVDWTVPDTAPVLLARGEIGDVASTGGAFTAELRGAAAALERPVVEETSPECRAELGDARCGVALRPLTSIVRIVAVDGSTVRMEAAVSDGILAWGRLRWLDGANGGLGANILAHEGDALTLGEPPPFAVEAGTRAMVSQGCDKRLETCAGRFANVVNFRGEPHLPGNDLLTRYPGA